MKKLLLTTLIAASVSACGGYEPLYNSIRSDVYDVQVGSVSMVSVSKRPGERRIAQRMNRSLKDVFRAEVENGYVLNVQVDEDREVLAVERNATEQRSEVVLTAYVTLNKDGKQAFKTNIEKSAPYNIEATPFATESAIDRARLSASNALSDEIIKRVSYFLHENKE